MSKDLPQQQPNQSEEVDLGQLFKLIGNAFDRFFKFIGSIFTSIYKVILALLVHIYKRLPWYAGAVVLGVVVGFIIDVNSKKMYGANMFIETNFNSTRQVYENIKQFHQLSYLDKDSLELADKLNISPGLASNLKGFYVEPDLDENNIAEMYSRFYERLDSISRSEMTYDRYRESLKPYNYKIHKIGVASTDKHIYKKIEKAFVNQISDNEYLNDLLKTNRDILEKKDQTLLQQVQKTDSLANEYLRIRINESQKDVVPGSGTNLYLGDAESSAGNLIVDESRIVQLRLNYESQRRKIDSVLAVQKNVVNVLATFPESGYDIREWYDKKKFVLPLVLFGITFSIFLFLGLGKFLKEQS
ncbi:hypothetical protein [Tamlana crocina]|uniref:Polysaccharide chain length determinant N-terminal domain-containing protein n=1 Tax=Tamlana crocina TaxID=393006 RepID=A0ABX1D6N5_9FLAO|nr:hypothetical protein [Tamlana crocina]NJX14033.1 hypothetical protein [Tamlana crocina]